MATATPNETVDPLPASRPVRAAPPASDAAMSVHALGHRARDSFMVQAEARHFKQR
jgi:hypothetical protein